MPRSSRKAESRLKRFLRALRDTAPDAARRAGGPMGRGGGKVKGRGRGGRR